METVLVMAHAMGRTLVLPPQQKIYLLHNVSLFGGGGISCYSIIIVKMYFYDFVP
jgi:hypothetical protein